MGGRISVNWSDEEIRRSLESFSPLENLYVIRLPSDEVGVIYGLYRDGKIYAFHMSDDDHARACVGFLQRYGSPILSTRDEVEEYEQKLLTKVRNQDEE
jgi:hypothetical protein